MVNNHPQNVGQLFVHYRPQLESWPKGQKAGGAGQVKTRRRSAPGRGNSEGKDLRGGMGLASSRNSNRPASADAVGEGLSSMRSLRQGPDHESR